MEKVAVITGGANGIGKEFVGHFAGKGLCVAFIDKDGAAGEGLLKNLPDAGRHLFFAGDIADESALEAFAAEIKKKYGRADILINNACLSKRGILSGCGYEDFLYVQRVGVTAPYYLSKLLLPLFPEGGSIINISSTRASQSQPDTESYSAAKGGIISLTHALAASLAGKVRVNCISPGWIDTAGEEFSGADNSQHTAGRVGTSEDIVSAAEFLISNGFMNGQNVTVDGGMSKLMIYHNDHGWKFEPES